MQSSPWNDAGFGQAGSSSHGGGEQDNNNTSSSSSSSAIRSSLGQLIERSTSAPPSSSMSDNHHHQQAGVSLVGSDLFAHMTTIDSQAPTPLSSGNSKSNNRGGGGGGMTSVADGRGFGAVSFLPTDNHSSLNGGGVFTSGSAVTTVAPASQLGAGLARPLSAADSGSGSGGNSGGGGSVNIMFLQDPGGFQRSRSCAPPSSVSDSLIRPPPGMPGLHSSPAASMTATAASMIGETIRRPASTGGLLEGHHGRMALRPAAKTLMDLIQEDFPVNNHINNSFDNNTVRSSDDIPTINAAQSFQQVQPQMTTTVPSSAPIITATASNHFQQPFQQQQQQQLQQQHQFQQQQQQLSYGLQPQQSMQLLLQQQQQQQLQHQQQLQQQKQFQHQQLQPNSVLDTLQGQMQAVRLQDGMMSDNSRSIQQRQQPQMQQQMRMTDPYDIQTAVTQGMSSMGQLQQQQHMLSQPRYVEPGFDANGQQQQQLGSIYAQMQVNQQQPMHLQQQALGGQQLQTLVGTPEPQQIFYPQQQQQQQHQMQQPQLQAQVLPNGQTVYVQTAARSPTNPYGGGVGAYTTVQYQSNVSPQMQPQQQQQQPPPLQPQLIHPSQQQVNMSTGGRTAIDGGQQQLYLSGAPMQNGTSQQQLQQQIAYWQADAVTGGTAVNAVGATSMGTIIINGPDGRPITLRVQAAPGGGIEAQQVQVPPQQQLPQQQYQHHQQQQTVGSGGGNLAHNSNQHGRNTRERGSSGSGGGGRGRRGANQSSRRSADPAKGQSSTTASVSSSLTSPVLDEFRSSKNRQWSIFQIEGHVVDFCMDQNGSRFIQQRLEMGDQLEQQIVAREVLPAIRRLRNDVFGNYVVQKLLDFGSEKVRADVRDTLAGEMMQLSLQMYGCRVVQKALETLPEDDVARLLSEFHHNVLCCIHDQNGNHVIQKCIEVISSRARKAVEQNDEAMGQFLRDQISFIIDDVLANTTTLACHPYGCRVLQRMLEHCNDEKKFMILDQIKSCHRKLLDDQYGNYVIQHVLQFGREEDRDSILQIVVESGLLCLSRQKFASNVVEKLLKYGNSNQRRAVVREMLHTVQDPSIPNQPPGGTSVVLLMVRDAYANYVVQTTLDVVPESDEKVLLLRELSAHTEELRNYTFAKHIVAKLMSLNSQQ